MTLLAALVTFVDVTRELGLDERPEVRRAIKRVEPKIEELRKLHARLARRRKCRRCERNCSGVVCWNCWHLAPPELRGEWRDQLDDQNDAESSRAIVRALIEWADKERLVA